MCCLELFGICLAESIDKGIQKQQAGGVLKPF